MNLIRNYVENHFEGTEGWCGPHVWLLMQYFDGYQRAEGSSGPAAEIGVYYGKYFNGLACFKHDAIKHLVIDVFEMQEFNLGGVGQRVDRPHHERQMQRFKDNIAECGLDISTIHIMKSDSLTLNASDIRESMGKDFQKFSFFSVDGCHEFTHAYHDIGLAFELTASNGLIMVDDYYNPTWPGVHEAVAKHFFGAAPLFVPLFWVRNKLALCHVNYHSVFLEGLQNYLSENFDEMPIRKAVRYGWETLSIEPRDGTPLIL